MCVEHNEALRRERHTQNNGITFRTKSEEIHLPQPLPSIFLRFAYNESQANKNRVRHVKQTTKKKGGEGVAF